MPTQGLVTRTLVALTAAAGALAAPPAAHAQFAYTPIEPPGALHASAHGINAAGQIVGLYDDATGATLGFVYAGGSFTSFAVSGARATFASGIDAAGRVVGSYHAEQGGTPGPHGFVYADGAFTVLDVPGARSTSADGMNDAGQIVGAYVDGATSRGFLATPLAVPEAGTLALLASGLGPRGRRRRRDRGPAAQAPERLTGFALRLGPKPAGCGQRAGPLYARAIPPRPCSSRQRAGVSAGAPGRLTYGTTRYSLVQPPAVTSHDT
jgi:probable HAF family extracellular repeat protein